MTKIAIVDDHCLVRSGLSNTINCFKNYKVLFEADNGKDFIQKINPDKLPEIVILDISMPEMDGYETARWIRTNYPSIKTIALSVDKDERSVIRMIRNGANGYLPKICMPFELETALNVIRDKGMFFNNILYNNFSSTINNSLSEMQEKYEKITELNATEKIFLQHACTELSLKQIAAEMCVSPRTVDGYRDKLFEKLEVNSRVGLVLVALKSGYIQL